MDPKKQIESAKETNILHKVNKIHQIGHQCKSSNIQLSQTSSDVTKKLNLMSHPTMNVMRHPVSPVVMPDMLKVPSNLGFSNVPCKKLRIVSRNGKDLGEFNVEMQNKNSSKGQIFTITKLNISKSVSKPVTPTVIPVSLQAMKRTIPRILRQKSSNATRNKIMRLIPESNMKCDKSSVSSIEPVTCCGNDHLTDISKKISIHDDEINRKNIENSNNKILILGNEVNLKSSLNQTVIDNSQKHQEAKHKLNKLARNAGSANNVNTSLNTEVEIPTTLVGNNTVSSTTGNVSYKEIAESPYPIVSCQKLILIANNNNSTQVISKIHKKNDNSSIKTTKIIKCKADTSLGSVSNSMQACNLENQRSDAKTDNMNNTESREVRLLRVRNNSLLINSEKIKQVEETKTQRDIMTIVPNCDNLSLNKNAFSTCRKYPNCISNWEKSNREESGCIILPDDTESVNSDHNISRSGEVVTLSNGWNKNCSKDNLFQKDTSKSWDVIKKAVNSVRDEELRAQALKALMECSISVERHVPKHPPVEYKSVHDKQVQTSVFSLLDPQFFVLINKDIESLQRLQHVTLYESPHIEDPLHVQDSPHTQDPPHIQDPLHIQDSPCIQDSVLQDNSDNGKQLPLFKNSVMSEENDFDIDSYINKICEENLGALQVKETLSTTNVKYQRIIEQLQKDFELVKKYDEEGLLGIHNAVLKNNVFDVQRHIMVLKQCKESIDVFTEDGVTSLELAIKYDMRGDIVKLLLQSGAQPVILQPLRESALIIAAKQSSALLPMLVNHVPNPKLLNQVDAEEGVTALISAGANVNLKDMKSGRTPLFHALESNNRSNRSKIVQKLLHAGATTSVTNFAGYTPLPVINDGKSVPFMMALRKDSAQASPSAQ
ncbi:PREDICTED: uncharacterized protein LOC106744425 isoform X2 [Dinoponera quadriceps]|uniref:Uncharacterized protein LOC106744425 isoform X2 n=1 Tax=Dinoponera quadriceps TaxID=609295 RepID=A0A6P3X8W4_DINQU|nr:PREDICTED: uncharacterized protein LOC106744425 isoform X2 [Dinoponera quadriceps]